MFIVSLHSQHSLAVISVNAVIMQLIYRKNLLSPASQYVLEKFRGCEYVQELESTSAKSSLYDLHEIISEQSQQEVHTATVSQKGGNMLLVGCQGQQGLLC